MPAHAEHLAPRLRGSADPRRRRTASAYPWRAAAVRRLLCFSLLLHRSAADRSNQFVQQMRRTATHIGDCTLCSLRFLFPHPRWLVPPCLPLWAAVCAFGKGDGASPRWDSIPSVLGRLCAFARGPRQDDRTAFCPFDFVRDKGRWSQATASQPQSPAVRGFFDGQAR